MISIFGIVLLSIFIVSIESFHFQFSILSSHRHLSPNKSMIKSNNLKMLDLGTIDTSPQTYAALFAVTMIPSLLIVKFVGEQADNSRGSLSEKTQREFKKRMMQQPNLDFALPTSEEDELKKQIAKAYMQDKDVDVAVLEDKLRKRIQWRKEMIQQKRKAELEGINKTDDVDDDGW